MAYPCALEPDSIFAKDFRVVRGLRVGGMGSVYVVIQISTGKRRALKLLASQLVNNAEMRERFVREAQAAAEIESDHVVEIVTAGVDEESKTPYIAMELLRGEELADAVDRRGAFPLGEVREILAQIGHALERAHAQRIVHRDLKPENIFLALPRRRGTTFTAKLLDFGVAKFLALGASEMGTAPVGSPLFMAPEQTDSFGNICPATDVWALGLLAFYLLTGKSYWLGAERASVPALLREVCLDPLVTASFRAEQLGVSDSIPEGFDEWFGRCVDREVDQRYVEAGEAVRAFLQAVPEGDPIHASAYPEAIAATEDESVEPEEIGSGQAALALRSTSQPPSSESMFAGPDAPHEDGSENLFASPPSSGAEYESIWDGGLSADAVSDEAPTEEARSTKESAFGTAFDLGADPAFDPPPPPHVPEPLTTPIALPAAAVNEVPAPSSTSATTLEKRQKLKRVRRFVAVGVALGSIMGGVLGWHSRSVKSAEPVEGGGEPSPGGEAPAAHPASEVGEALPPARKNPCPGNMIFESGRSSLIDPLTPFCLDRTEVTVRAYVGCVDAGVCDEVVGETNYPTLPERLKKPYASLCNWTDSMNDPINCIDWRAAFAYCDWRDATLPSEGQWRFAASVTKPLERRVDASQPAEPTANLCDVECFDWGVARRQLLHADSTDWDGYAGSSPVGTFARFFPLAAPVDLEGNVAEWTSTAVSRHVESGTRDGEPHRVVLGTSFMPHPIEDPKVPDRITVPIAAKSFLIGFRCVAAPIVEAPHPEPTETSEPVRPSESARPISEFGPPLPPGMMLQDEDKPNASADPIESAKPPVESAKVDASAAPSDLPPAIESVPEPDLKVPLEY